MLISLRSHLIAGTAAIVGASAVALPPVAQQLPTMPMTSVAPVALAAFDNPVEQLLGTVQMAQNYLFATYFNGSDQITPGAGEANWPSAGFEQTGGDYLNYLLYKEISLGYYNNVGVLPQSTYDAQPVVRQVAINEYNYINATLTGAIGAVGAIAGGVWNFPAAVFDAFQLAVQGNVAQAITVLSDAIFSPINTAVEAVAAASTYVAESIAVKAAAVAAALPQILINYAGWATGSLNVLGQKALGIVNTVFTSLGTGNWQGAWNAVVDGLLGPSGLPGAALNLLIGAGIQTGPILTEADIPANFVPSYRTASQSAAWTIAEALATPAPPAAAAKSAAASRVADDTGPAVAEISEPAADAAVSAPVVALPAAETTAGDAGDSGSAPKPVKSHRTAKRAAKADADS
ncbi:MAG: hypothetical protein ACR2JM_02960 [Mycobacterium sp.]